MTSRSRRTLTAAVRHRAVRCLATTRWIGCVTILALTLLASPVIGVPGDGGTNMGAEGAARDALTVRPRVTGGAAGPVLHAICYGPHRDGQRPGGPTPTAAQMREDLELMAPHWRLLRVYGAAEFADTLLAEIRTGGFDMQVMLGAWIAPGPAADNERELAAAIRLANAYPDVVTSVCVSNETQVAWSAHQYPLDDLIAHVRHVREAVSVPVTVADDIDYWGDAASRRLSAEVDFITLHAHPLWNGVLLDHALAWLDAQLTVVETVHPERPVVIGETGWATSVLDHGEQAQLIRGRPGEQEQKRFHGAVRDWAETRRVTVFFFEAFDENWKGGPYPAEVEKHWGLFRADRTPKAALQPAER
jgi:exo-beta-1,3-glucanase (GH17 family)